MQGIQVFDESGNVVIDSNVRVTKFLGIITIEKQHDNQKTITDSRLLKGKPWFAYQQTRHRDVVGVSVSGSSITLSFLYKSSDDAANRGYSIIYGVY